jgi:hypothetical protein
VGLVNAVVGKAVTGKRETVEGPDSGRNKGNQEGITSSAASANRKSWAGWSQLDGATMPPSVARATYEAVEIGRTKLRYP